MKLYTINQILSAKVQILSYTSQKNDRLLTLYSTQSSPEMATSPVGWKDQN